MRVRRKTFPPRVSYKTTMSTEYSEFDMDALERAKRALESRAQGDAVRGNLEYVGDEFRGQVVFVPRPDGKFLVNQQYLPKT